MAVAGRWQATSREELERETERLRQENERLRRELERTERERKRIEHERERLQKERDRLEKERDRLEKELETARRAAKRQAAPFSKGAPSPCPRRPGRKPGRAYGPRAWRPVPPHVDEVVEVLPPAECATCGGVIGTERVHVQYQADLPPVRPHVTAFHVHVGRCRRCGRRVQGRDARQTSTATGAAASQVGPRALAWAAWLHTGLGVPFAKVATILRTGFGLTITAGGLVHALHRVGGRTAPTYDALVAVVRRSPVVAPDETGWKVGGRLWWLWVFVTPDVTVYAIQPGRGYTQAAAVLGPATTASSSATAGPRTASCRRPRTRPVSPTSCAAVTACSRSRSAAPPAFRTPCAAGCSRHSPSGSGGTRASSSGTGSRWRSAGSRRAPTASSRAASPIRRTAASSGTCRPSGPHSSPAYDTRTSKRPTGRPSRRFGPPS